MQSAEAVPAGQGLHSPPGARSPAVMLQAPHTVLAVWLHWASRYCSNGWQVPQGMQTVSLVGVQACSTKEPAGQTEHCITTALDWNVHCLAMYWWADAAAHWAGGPIPLQKVPVVVQGEQPLIPSGMYP